MKFNFLYESMLNESTSFTNWVKPKDAVIAREYKVEYELKRLGDYYGNPFPTSADFVSAVKKAKVVAIDRATDRTVGYRSGVSRSREEMVRMLKGYRSWPEFRNDSTVDALYAGFGNNSPMEMPIILKQGNSMRIFSGNTRIDVAFQMGLPNYKAIVVEF
ncbi:hypothetical protein [Alishewanella phage vB_AspM_Slicko01]|nr:hypothetical protein [Alishewanella phage vB_AspM_Slicko01]